MSYYFIFYICFMFYSFYSFVDILSYSPLARLSFILMIWKLYIYILFVLWLSLIYYLYSHFLPLWIMYLFLPLTRNYLSILSHLFFSTLLQYWYYLLQIYFLFLSYLIQTFFFKDKGKLYQSIWTLISPISWSISQICFSFWVLSSR